jgi:hypothetical protein
MAGSPWAVLNSSESTGLERSPGGWREAGSARSHHHQAPRTASPALALAAGGGGRARDGGQRRGLGRRRRGYGSHEADLAITAHALARIPPSLKPHW